MAEVSGTVLPLFFMLLAPFLIERLLLPVPAPPWRRPAGVLAVQFGLCLLLYAPLLLLLRRPWFAMACLLVLLVLLALISRAKYRSLREPFIAQDFSYFVDALRFPRLYLPFLGIWSAVAIALSAGSALIVGLLLEPVISWSTVATVAGGCLLLGGLLLTGGHRRAQPLSLEPDRDLAALGLLTSLWRYAMAERQPWQGRGASCLGQAFEAAGGELPNLVVIQSESFFDPRRLLTEISTEVLQTFDLLRSEAVAHGPLQVPAWGANTVRTEYAFLSGIANERLGIHRFKPYRTLARQGLPTLAGYLKKLGYRTVCLHPYDARFYDRHQVLPLLGFDEFIDISRFCAADYHGQYVGDVAVAREICAELEHHDRANPQPLFLFAITMENHGPLHLEKARPDDRQRMYTGEPPEECDDLTVFLHHLEQADCSFGMVREQLAAMQREGWLCLYGDHLPIMPQVYQQLGEPDGTVDYLIWSSRHRTTNLASPQAVEQLLALLARLINPAECCECTSQQGDGRC